MMKIKTYFVEAAKCQCRAVVLTVKGLCFGVMRLFREYTHITWGTLLVITLAISIVEIGSARAERDSYSNTNARLQHELDSCLDKQIRFTKYNAE